MSTARTPDTMPPTLPDRDAEVVGGLPEPFARSMVDYLPGSVTWWDDGWLASTTAWGGKRLTRFADGEWRMFSDEERWSRRPTRSDDGTGLAAVLQAPDEDGGRFSRLDPSRLDGTWTAIDEVDDPLDITDWNGRTTARRTPTGHGAALGPRGDLIHVVDGKLVCGPAGDPRWQVPLPAGATVLLVSASPHRSWVLVVVRSGSRYQGHVFSTADGRGVSRGSLTEVVQPVVTWLDEENIVLTRERWPSLEPVVWSWRTGEVTPLWPTGTIGVARSLATGPHGGAVAAVESPSSARNIRSLDDPPSNDGNVRAEVIGGRDVQRFACLVHEPAGQPRGTCLMFPGGPHEPIFGGFAPMADALTATGWRVVRVNTRSSGLREGAYRPVAPVDYGVDDLADAHRALARFATGPVVVLGMSYGGYLGSLLAESSDAVRGAVVLAGFVSPCDIARSEHHGVRAFAREAFSERMGQAPRTLSTPHFLAHGARDRRIPVDELRRYDTPGGRFLAIETEGHGIHSDVAARTTYPPMFDWIEEITT